MLAGGVAGYQTTPEDASPLERAGRTIVGGGLGYAGGRGLTAAATREARAAGRTFDLEKLAEMRRGVARRAKAASAPPPPPPPPPMPGSGAPGTAKAPKGAAKAHDDYYDYLNKRGKWAPAEKEETTFPDQVVAYTTANMLSGIGTAVQNVIGGIQQNVYRPIELAGAGQWSDAATDIMAMTSGLGEHFARFGHTFKTGERYNQAVEAPTRGLVGGLKNPLNYPLRMLAATDEFMRSAASTGAQAVEAKRLMRENKGMTFPQVLTKYEDQILEAGAKAASEATFETGGSLLGTAGAKIAQQRQKLLNSNDKGEQALGVIMQWLLPMTRVPGVILGKGIRSVPVINEATGAVNIMRHLKSGDTRAAQREFSKTYLTTMANLAIYDQVQKGNITGDGPDNPQERARLMEAVDQEGNPIWRPNSIKVAGRWFDHSALGPLSFSMGSIANLTDVAKEYAQKPADKRDEPPALVGDLLARQTKTVSNAWYLRNLADILSAIKDGRVEGVAQQFVSSGDRLIPMGGLLNEIRRLEDPYAREVSKEIPRGILEREMNRLPSVGPFPGSRFVNPQLTATTGEGVERPRDILSTVLRGTAPGAMTPNPVAMEVSRLQGAGKDVSVTKEDDMYKGAKQSREQLRSIQDTTGHAVGQYVLDVMNNPKYKGMNDDQKADAIGKAVNQAKEASNITLGGQVARDPHQSALWLYATKPHYEDVRGTPEAIARKNWEIDQARAKLAAYKQRWPDDGEDRLQREDARAYNLADRSVPLDSEEIKELKKRIDKQTAGAYSNTKGDAEKAGLVGAGARVLPAAPPKR